MHKLLLLAPLLSLMACGSQLPLSVTERFLVPEPPDYDDAKNWAALPDRSGEEADRTPGEGLTNEQATAPADVFYLHPTIYFKTSTASQYWNASLADTRLNEAVDESAMRNQASIFNGAGRVYAPRYRQAHIKVFYPEGRAVSTQALDTAYADVLAAFDHYLNNWNNGRPIIIASHSQGTTHAKRLLRDRFDGKALQNRLVAAYLVGISVAAGAYADIPVCASATQTGCFVSWRTYRTDFEPKAGFRDTVQNIAVVNPLSWTTSEVRAPASLNKGGVLYNYKKGLLPELVWAERRGAGLFTNKPSFFGDIFFTRKNYHVGDYNLFWMNIRENAADRVKAFVEQ